MRFRTFDQQKSLAIVAFSLGYPAGGPGDRANNTLSLACLRAGEAAKSSTSGSGSGSSSDNKNAGAVLGVSMGALATAIMTLLLTM